MITIFGTNNGRKKEINEERLAERWLDYKVLWFSDIWIESPEEDGETFEANTQIKYDALKNAVSDQIREILLSQSWIVPIFSADSWIEIDFYKGFWVQSRRDGEGNYLTDEEIALQISKIASTRPESQRTARIKSCYITGLNPNSRQTIDSSTQMGLNNLLRPTINICSIEWKIIDKPSELVVPRMPFNSVFIPNWFNKPLSEMTSDEFALYIKQDTALTKSIDILQLVYETVNRVNKVF